MEIRLLRLPKVKEQLGQSTATIYRQIQAGTLPKPIFASPRTAGWVKSELDAVLRARVAGKSEAEIKELVVQLMTDRTVAV